MGSPMLTKVSGAFPPFPFPLCSAETPQSMYFPPYPLSSLPCPGPCSHWANTCESQGFARSTPNFPPAFFGTLSTTSPAMAGRGHGRNSPWCRPFAQLLLLCAPLFSFPSRGHERLLYGCEATHQSSPETVQLEFYFSLGPFFRSGLLVPLLLV